MMLEMYRRRSPDYANPNVRNYIPASRKWDRTYTITVQ